MELFSLVCDLHFRRGISIYPTGGESSAYHWNLRFGHLISIQIHIFCRLFWHFPAHYHPCISLYDTVHVVRCEKK